MVDYTFDDEDEDMVDHDSDHYDEEEEEEEEDDERVFILGTGVNRFMPQWDDQLLGPQNTFQFKKDYDNPPKALDPDQLHLHFCNNCKLTWLQGEKGPHAVQGHPSHHTYQHIYAGTNRSLVVFIDGACPSNGPSAKKSSVGVFFGPESPYNISRCLTAPSPTNQSAELTAAVYTLSHVRQVVEPARRAVIKAALPRSNEDHRRDIRHFRLILATDSSYLVDCLCNHIKKWKLVGGVYKNAKGQTMKNSEEFVKIEAEVDALSRVGIQVVWYQVPREHNKQADRLANTALRS